METPSGNYKAEVKRLIKKSHKFAQKISSAAINATEANILYRSMYVPSINYSFPAGILTCKEAEKVQGAPIQAFLSAMGYNSHTPREIVFGPPESGGIGLRHLFAEQGSMKASTLIQQIRADRPLGRLFQIQLRWAQRVAGISRPIMEEVRTPLPHVENETWITTMREFLAESELGIRIRGIEGPALKRENDIILMDAAVRSGLTDDEIKKINRCWIFLRAECLSDICTADGSSILDGAIDCSENTRISATDFWPRQPRPGKQNRKAWSNFILGMCVDGTTRLRNSLGRWTRSPSRQQWNAYYDPDWHLAATKEQTGQWVARKILNYTRRGWELSDPTEPIDIDRDSFIPTQVAERKNQQPLMSDPLKVVLQKPPDSRQRILSWKKYVKSLPEWTRDLIGTTRGNKCTRGLCTELCDENATIMVVSDGGHFQKSGSFGWVIGTSTEVLWEGLGIARGQPMSSYRAEAYGKLAWLCFLLHYARFLGIEIKCKIKNFCDNISVVRQMAAMREKTARDARQPDFDVIWQILETQDQLKQQAKQLCLMEHVRGHQDRNIPFEKLSQPAQLNVAADALATKALRRQPQDSSEPPKMIDLPACSAYLINAGEIQSSQEAKTLRWKWSDLKIQEYHQRRLGLSTTQLHRINWEAYRKARRCMSPSEQVFATKILIRWLPTGHRDKLFGNSITECHRCGEEETVDHIFTCTNNEEWKNGFLERLNRHLLETETAADIKRALMAGITGWLDKDRLTKQHRCPKTMRKCFELQSELGWNIAMCGLLDENWFALQDAHLRATQHKTKKGDNYGMTWATKLSSWLIREARKRWKERCEEVHSREEGTFSKTERETLEQVRNLYKLQDEVSHHDRDIFAEPLDEKLQKPTQTLQRWIKNTIPTVSRCIRDFRDKLSTRQNDIRKYFKTMTTRHSELPAPSTSTNPLSE